MPCCIGASISNHGFMIRRLLPTTIFLCASRRLLASLVLVLLAGCSSVSVQNPMGNNAVNDITLSYCITSSSGMNNIEGSLSDDEKITKFEKNIKLAMDDIQAHFLKNIENTPNLHINTTPTCLKDGEAADSTNELYLSIALSGYGSINKRWKRVLIGTGIVEGIAQGVIVGSATQNPWLGVAVAAEEMGSEYLVWNGVDWILGDTYAPVTLEGSLFYMKEQTSTIIWKDSSFVTENEDELSDEEKHIKSSQLIASLHKAESELFPKLNDYIKNKILKEHNNTN